MPQIPSQIKAQYNKKYYDSHYGTIISKLLEKRECIYCNKECMLANMSKHRKTKNHLANVARVNATSPTAETE